MKFEEAFDCVKLVLTALSLSTMVVILQECYNRYSYVLYCP